MANSYEQSGFDGSVSKVYTDYPYPPYNPEDEKIRLYAPGLDGLDTPSDRCFGGGLDPSKGMRVLVAGGGTGGDTLFLAEQLRDTPSEITYIDLSPGSMSLAQRGAEMRGLTNIRWINGSLMDIGEFADEPYDYINCCGVLMILQDPQAGLQALESVLAPNGAMGLLVYAPYGAQERYRLRDILSIINSGVASLTERVANGRALLDSMPPDWHADPANKYLIDECETDEGLRDALLHPHETDFTVTQLYSLLAGAGLQKVAFASPYTSGQEGYKPEYYLGSRIAVSLTGLPLPAREAVAERASNQMGKHVLYAAREPHAASLDDADIVPHYAMSFDEAAREALLRLAAAGRSRPVAVSPVAQHGNYVRLQFGEYGHSILKQVDGARPLEQIVAVVGDMSGEPSDVVMRAAKRILAPLREAEWVTLQQSGTPSFKKAHAIQQAQLNRMGANGPALVSNFALESLKNAVELI